jgi:hypothetical protein
MSLNKFKQGTDLGKDIKLDVGCLNLNSSESGVSIIKGNVFPNKNTTPGFLLSNVDGAGNLEWVIGGNPAGDDIKFTGTPPVVLGDTPVFSSADGLGVSSSGINLQDVKDKADSAVPFTGGSSSLRNLPIFSGQPDNSISLSGFSAPPAGSGNVGDVLYKSNSNGTLAFKPDDPGGDVSYNGTPPTSIGELTQFGGIDGKTIQNTGLSAPPSSTTAGYLLTNSDGNGALQWTPPPTSTGDVVYDNTGATQLGEITLYSNTSGKLIGGSGLIAPGKNSVAGYVLTNSDGNGALQWSLPSGLTSYGIATKTTQEILNVPAGSISPTTTGKELPVDSITLGGDMKQSDNGFLIGRTGLYEVCINISVLTSPVFEPNESLILFFKVNDVLNRISLSAFDSSGSNQWMGGNLAGMINLSKDDIIRFYIVGNPVEQDISIQSYQSTIKLLQ